MGKEVDDRATVKGTSLMLALSRNTKVELRWRRATHVPAARVRLNMPKTRISFPQNPKTPQKQEIYFELNKL